MDWPDGGASRAPRVRRPLGSARRRLLAAAAALTGPSLAIGLAIQVREQSSEMGISPLDAGPGRGAR